MKSMLCTFPGCGQRSLHETRRCPWHRNVMPSTNPLAPKLPAAPPLTSEWTPGIVHPTGGYDEIEEQSGGTVFYYRRNGAIHREDGPAAVGVHDNGRPERLEWWRNGEPHREDGPAKERYFTDGSINEIAYYMDGKHHRTDGPAIETFFQGGVELVVREYYDHGLIHRLDGPARFLRTRPGGSGVEVHFVHGHQLSPEEFEQVRNEVESGAPVEWVVAYIEGSRS